LYGRDGFVELNNYPYWHCPEPPMKRDDTVGGLFQGYKITSGRKGPIKSNDHEKKASVNDIES
jgi:hypothetical protein